MIQQNILAETIKSSEEINQELISTKKAVDTANPKGGSQKIEGLLRSVKILQGSILMEYYGDRTEEVKSLYEGYIHGLTEKLYQAIGIEAQQKVRAQIAALRMKRRG